MVGLSAPTDGLAERRRPDGHDHELLEVDAVVGVDAAVENVHHGHRQYVSIRPTDVAIQRDFEVVSGCFGDGQAGAEDRVCTYSALVIGAVEVEQFTVDPTLIERFEPFEHAGDFAVHKPDRRQHSLAHVAVATVAKLDGLVLASRSTTRNGGPTASARRKHDFDLDRGVSA